MCLSGRAGLVSPKGTAPRGMLTDMWSPPRRWSRQRPEASPPRGPVVSRRSLLVLAAGAAITTAGCSSDPVPRPSTSPAPDPDVALTATVADEESVLIELYDATIAAFPDLTVIIAIIRDEHAAHRESVSLASDSPGDDSPTASSPAAANVSPIAPTPQLALTNLMDAERRAIGQRSQACESAESTDTARLLALIAASEAGHLEYLRGATA